MRLPMTGAVVKVYCTIVKADAKQLTVRNGNLPLPLGDTADKTFSVPRDRVLAFSKVGGWVQLHADVAKLVGLA